MPFNNSLQKFALFFFSTDRHVEKESLAEYIAKKREMFLVQVCDVFPFSFPTMFPTMSRFLLLTQNTSYFNLIYQ